MKILACIPIVLLQTSVPAAAIAQVTQSYSYDGNGRLTGVTTTGSAGTNTAAYVYDDADNRTSRSQTGTSAYAAILSLPLDQLLAPNQAIVSPDGRYSLARRSSGVMELWAQDTARHDRTQAFANLFMVDDAGFARFLPALEQEKNARGHLTLTDDGDLLVLAQDNTAVLWRSESASTSAVSQ